MKFIVTLDAVRDLPKVCANLGTLLVTIQNREWRYGSPCAIGAMINDRDLLVRLDRYTDEPARTGPKACIPRFKSAEQMDDLLCLQHDFDTGHADMFLSTLRELEEKYLSPPPAKNDKVQG